MGVNLKGCYTVKPSESTWQGVISLSIFDQIGSIAHEPVIYLYRQPPKSWLSPDPDAIADALKQSLSKALVHFYPLAGRVRWSGEGGGRLELNCNAAGAEFVEAEADSELDHFFGNDHFLPSQKCRRLIPDVNYKYRTLPFEEIPTLLVQLTRFACGGIGLGLALSQVVADGTAAVHFMFEWAGLARGEPLKMAPYLDRGALGAGEPSRVSISGDPAAYCLPKLMIPENSKGFDHQDEMKMDKTTTAKLRLSKDQVEKLKKMVNAGVEDSKIARAYTRFEALAAHIWRCVNKARNHEFPEQPTTISIPIDSRSRVRPPLPQNYFGNAVCTVLSRSAAGDLVSRPLGYAASVVRAAIEKANNEFIWTTIDGLKSLPDLTCLQNLQSHLDGTPSIKNPNMAAISWLTMPMHGLDFGWGNEMYMGPGDIEGEWSYLLPCLSGDGSVILLLCLQTAHMDSFKKHFYDDIIV